MFEADWVSIFGSLFTILVKKGISFEKIALNPIIVLFTGSEP